MRLDESYFETQAEKVKWLIKKAEEEGAEAILQPGDFFDSPDVPLFVIQYYVNLLLESNMDVFTVFGQHDLRYHSKKKENTPLAVLLAAGVAILPYSGATGDKWDIYGASWGEEVPEVKNKKMVNVLLMHKMIVKEKIWEGQEEYVYAKHLFRKYPDYDLIVAGDNHESFLVRSGDRYVVNCGSLMRSRVDQRDHKPCCYIYDAERKTLEQFEVPIQKADRILDLKAAKREKKRDERLEAFIGGLSDIEDLGLNFLSNLDDAMGRSKLGQGVRQIISEVVRDE